MSRGKRKNGDRREAPPVAGAVDLDALRQPPKEQIDAAVAELLVRNRMICSCGQRVREDAVELIGVVLQATPQGPVVTLATSVHHSASCPSLHELLQTEDNAWQPLALRPLPEVMWLDEETDKPESSTEVA